MTDTEHPYENSRAVDHDLGETEMQEKGSCKVAGQPIRDAVDWGPHKKMAE